MRVVDATLVKRATEDNLVQVQDDVPIGKKYEVDLDTVIDVEQRNIERNVNHTKQMVLVMDGDRGWQPFYTELLRAEGVLVCVLCGRWWEPGIKNKCECGGFATWGEARGADPMSWHRTKGAEVGFKLGTAEPDSWAPNQPPKEDT